MGAGWLFGEGSSGSSLHLEAFCALLPPGSAAACLCACKPTQPGSIGLRQALHPLPPAPEGLTAAIWGEMAKGGSERVQAPGQDGCARVHGCSTERCRMGWWRGRQQEPCFARGPWGVCVCVHTRVCTLGPGPRGCWVSPESSSGCPLARSTRHFAATPAPVACPTLSAPV